MSNCNNKEIATNVVRCNTQKCGGSICKGRSPHFGLQRHPPNTKCLKLDDLYDTKVPNPSEGNYLCFTGGNWIDSDIDCLALQGPQGATGPQGIPGIDGATGMNGIDGVTGPQGNPGVQGATGPQGNPGMDGNDGATGPQGDTGPQGATGLQGATGMNGGDGATGPQGDIGAQGATGLQGATGPQGDIGMMGATGPQGDIGMMGATGPQGDIGLQGVTGPQGETGPQGATGFCPQTETPTTANGMSGGVGIIVHGTLSESGDTIIIASNISNSGLVYSKVLSIPGDLTSVTAGTYKLYAIAPAKTISVPSTNVVVT